MSSDNRNSQNIENVFIDYLKNNDKLDISAISEAASLMFSKNMPDFSQTVKSAIACNEALASSIKGLNFKALTALSTESKETVNAFFVKNSLDFTHAIKSAIVCNESLANYIKELDLNNSVFLSSSNIDYDEIVKEEYTEEIVDQLINDIEPKEIAHKLEKKTNIKWEIWLPIIFMLIQTLLMIYSTFIQTPQEINNYHIEIHQETSSEESNQITNDVTDDMNNKTDTQN